MQSNNIGLVIRVKPVKDHDIYIKLLSSDDEVLSGIVYGGNSSKKRSIYQIGYFIEFNQKLKNTNSITSINGEIVNPFIGNIINDKFKSFSLLAIVSIINKNLYEGQRINGLFISIRNLINYINVNQHWLVNFCEWLLYYLKILGYEIDYINKNNMKYFNLNSLVFQNEYVNDNLVPFPHELFRKKKISYKSIKSFFIIFETVFIKNHLQNLDDKMPITFLNFKNIILNELNRSSK